MFYKKRTRFESLPEDLLPTFLLSSNHKLKMLNHAALDDVTVVCTGLKHVACQISFCLAGSQRTRGKSGLSLKFKIASRDIFFL